MKVLIDTNVLLDWALARQPHFQSSQDVIRLVETGHLTAAISAISINNFEYIFNKSGNARSARDFIGSLLQLFELVPLDRVAVENALASPLADFEDCIQLAAAQQVGARYIVTRDLKDFAASPIDPVSPRELLNLLHSPGI